MDKTIQRTIECPGCKAKIPLTFVLPMPEPQVVEKPVETIVEVEKEVLREVTVEKPVPLWWPTFAAGGVALVVGVVIGKLL